MIILIAFAIGAISYIAFVVCKHPVENKSDCVISPQSTMTERHDGTKQWCNKNGEFHREDCPAIIYVNGTKKWWVNGKRHREYGPAIERADGSKHWYKNDKLHREDGPAIIYANGTKEWFINGKRHHEDGPAIEWEHGTKHWFLNGKLHREDGPAIECVNGYKSWHLNGELHREDGPAIEHADGNKYWYLNGKQVSESDLPSQSSMTEVSRQGEEVWRLNEEWSNDLSPIDEKLKSLRYCIVGGHDEDAQNHIFDLLRGLQCKDKDDSELTPEGLELKSFWKKNERV